MIMYRWFVVIIVMVGLAFGALGHAQEGGKEPDGTAKEQDAATINFPVPLPVVVTESQDAAAARERAEMEAAKQQQRDLAAQEGMNFQAKRVADYALLQTVLITIGTIALIWTLWETRRMAVQAERASDAAWAANTTTKETAARQSRAYIQPVGGTLRKPDKKSSTILTNYSTVELKCVNHGASIASNIYCLYEAELVDIQNSKGFLKWRDPSPMFISYHRNVAPKTEFIISLSQDVVKLINECPFDGNSAIVIRGFVYYRDVFDETFRSGFVLLNFVPVNLIDSGEIPLGMDQTGKDFPTFEPISLDQQKSS